MNIVVFVMEMKNKYKHKDNVDRQFMKIFFFQNHHTLFSTMTDTI